MIYEIKIKIEEKFLEKEKTRDNPGSVIYMAERVGFEPTVPCDITGFQDRLLKPLGHLSKKQVLLYQR